MGARFFTCSVDHQILGTLIQKMWLIVPYNTMKMYYMARLVHYSYKIK